MARIALLLCLAIAPRGPAPQTSGDPPRTNPFPYTRRSVRMGRAVYLRHCGKCHRPNGKPVLPSDPAATRPADLTRPENWEHGSSDGELFDTLREGTEEMPGFRDKLREEEVWRVIHFLRSLASVSASPPPTARRRSGR